MKAHAGAGVYLTCWLLQGLLRGLLRAVGWVAVLQRAGEAQNVQPQGWSLLHEVRPS